jgi:N-acetylglucosamine-6-phosphate deacetylase
MSYRLALSVVVLLTISATALHAGEPADLILHHGKIVTVDPRCLTREQAIRLCTVNCAYLTFEEKEKGSLEPGKLADLIVLDRDILTCPVDEVKQIAVQETYLGGKRVYQAS